jgi:cysteine-rich repeat protein
MALLLFVLTIGAYGELTDLSNAPVCPDMGRFPAGAPPFDQEVGKISTCSSKGYLAPGHTTMGEWGCFSTELCASLVGYLGSGGDADTCLEFLNLYHGNGVCDEWLDCPEYTNDGGDCSGSNVIYPADAGSEKLEYFPVIERPTDEHPSCDDKNADQCLNVTVFIVDFGEDGITSGMGFIGLSEIRALEEAIVIESDPYCLKLGCSHEIGYRSDLFSTLHNYMVVYTTEGKHSLGSTDFKHGGAFLTIDLGVCGDGKAEEYEECDDANLVNGDGCSSECVIEDGWICEKSPSECTQYGDNKPAIVNVLEDVEINVDLYDDSENGDCSPSSSGSCNLRAALIYAQTLDKAAVTINYAGVTVLNRELPLIFRSLHLKGAGRDVAIIDAQTLGRVVTVACMKDIKISGLKLQNGFVHGFGSLILNMGLLTIEDVFFLNGESVESGGMIWTASENLTVSNCRFENGQAGSEGGAIENDGYVNIHNSYFKNIKAPEGAAVHNCADMDVFDSEFVENEAEKDGGGMTSIGAFTMYRTTFTRNHAGSVGGGFYSGDTSHVEGCVFKDNHVSETGNGGGLGNSGSTTVVDCVFEGNKIGKDTTAPKDLSEDDASDGEAQNGGGLYSRGSIEIKSSSFDGNIATQGAGIFNEGQMYIDGCTFGTKTHNKGLYQSGITYSTGHNVAGTAEIVFRGDDTTFATGTDLPHANRIASCGYEGACGTHAACEEKTGGAIGVRCYCPQETFPIGDPHELCRSRSSAQVYASAKRIQRSLIKPATETFQLQFTKTGMGEAEADFSWALSTELNTDTVDWFVMGETSGQSGKDVIATDVTLITTGLTADTFTHSKTFVFNTDLETQHTVTVELSVDNVADPEMSEITWSHTGSIVEDEVLVGTIIARDLDNYEMKHGGDTFVLSKLVDGKASNENHTFTDNGDGTYTIVFIPDNSVGKYDFSVSLQNKQGVQQAFTKGSTAINVELIDDTIEKVVVSVIVIGFIGGAVGGYYYYMKKTGKTSIDFETEMTVDEEKKWDLTIEQRLNYFWLFLDIFDVGSDLAALIFAFMGDIGNVIVSYIFAAFVGLSLAISTKVVYTRLRCIFNVSAELSSAGDAKVFGTDVSIANLQKSFRQSAKIAPVEAGGEKKETENEAELMETVLNYSRAVMNRDLFAWILRLCLVEDVPSFIFNMYFIGSAWPNLNGFTTPMVSIVVTCISIGYKLSYIQKLAKCTRTKAQLERQLKGFNLNKEVILDLVKNAKKSIKADVAREEGKGM